jgi:hypothetical protein
MTSTNYHWIIEYVPEDCHNERKEIVFVGTMEEVEKESEKHMPEFAIDEVVFQRRGRDAAYCEECGERIRGRIFVHGGLRMCGLCVDDKLNQR